MKSINVKVLMGHSIGVEDSYYRPQEKDISEDYKKAIPSLTISGNRETNQAQSYQELQDLRTQLEQYKHMVESQTQDMTTMREDMNNIMFEVLWKVKQNDGRVGNDRTVLDENRHFTIYEDYTDGRSTKSRSVSIPIDGVKIDE